MDGFPYQYKGSVTTLYGFSRNQNNATLIVVGENVAGGRDIFTCGGWKWDKANTFYAKVLC